MNKSLLLFLTLIAPAVAQTQSDVVQVARSNDGSASASFSEALPELGGIRRLPGEPELPALRIPSNAKVTVSRRWNEKKAAITIPFRNDSPAELKVTGVQSSGSLYVVTFPTFVQSGGTGEIQIAYSAEAGSESDLDIVRLLTNQGIKVIEVTQDREPVLGLEKSKLEWNVGDKDLKKTVLVVVADNVAELIRVKAYGDGNQAEFKTLDKGRYRIEVTLGSAEKPTQFPVMLEFKPGITGVQTVIYCSVVAP